MQDDDEAALERMRQAARDAADTPPASPRKTELEAMRAHLASMDLAPPPLLQSMADGTTAVDGETARALLAERPTWRSRCSAGERRRLAACWQSLAEAQRDEVVRVEARKTLVDLETLFHADFPVFADHASDFIAGRRLVQRCQVAFADAWDAAVARLGGDEAEADVGLVVDLDTAAGDVPRYAKRPLESIIDADVRRTEQLRRRAFLARFVVFLCFRFEERLCERAGIQTWRQRAEERALGRPLLERIAYWEHLNLCMALVVLFLIAAGVWVAFGHRLRYLRWRQLF